jgi:hypothetical protein
MDEAVVEQAKELARARGTSVSAMFTNVVRSMAAGRSREIKLGPITRKATGIAKWPAGKEYKELLEEALMEKYGIKE